MPMQKTERRLLGLRRRVTAPSLLGRTSESQEDKSSSSSRYSSSPRSADNLRCRESPSAETVLIPPFALVDTAKDREGGGEDNLLSRPSEHFLEVLVEEHKGRTLPKIQAKPPPFSGNPHRRPVACEQEWKRGTRSAAETGADVRLLNALNGSNIASYKHLKTQGTDCMSPGGLQECALDELPSRRKLTSVSSLPVIVPRCRKTSGELSEVHITVPPKERNADTPVGNAETLTALKYLHSAQQSSPSHSGGDCPGVDDEKFGMICEWLKECEEARTS